MLESELRRLGDLIVTAEKLMGSFWWNVPSNAAGRRDFEKRYNVDWIEWEEGRDAYRARYVVNCSCSNIYARGEYFRNGRKTTLTAIRNSYVRMMRERGLTP